MRQSRYLITLVLAASALATNPGAAEAGSYSVSGLCGLWSPFTNNGARVAVYAEAGCGGLTARNSVGDYRSAQGTQGGWRLTAPAGATITRLAMHAYLLADRGWDAVIFDNKGGVFVGCPGNVGCENRSSAQANFNTGVNARRDHRPRPLLRKQLPQLGREPPLRPAADRQQLGHDHRLQRPSDGHHGRHCRLGRLEERHQNAYRQRLRQRRGRSVRGLCRRTSVWRRSAGRLLLRRPACAVPERSWHGERQAR